MMECMQSSCYCGYSSAPVIGYVDLIYSLVLICLDSTGFVYICDMFGELRIMSCCACVTNVLPLFLNDVCVIPSKRADFIFQEDFALPDEFVKTVM